MADNVVEVDFARPNPAAALDEVYSLLADLQSMARFEAWREQGRRRDRRRIRELEEQLRESQPVTEERALVTLIGLYQGEPVRAITIAKHLYETPLHTTVVRVGLALRKLADAGRVCRIETDNRRIGHSWAPVRR